MLQDPCVLACVAIVAGLWALLLIPLALWLLARFSGLIITLACAVYLFRACF